MFNIIKKGHPDVDGAVVLQECVYGITITILCCYSLLKHVLFNEQRTIFENPLLNSRHHFIQLVFLSNIPLYR